MKRKDYIEQMQRNTEGMQSLSTGLCPNCAECASDMGYGDDIARYNADLESGKLSGAGSGFSRSACEICGDTDGGDREPYHYVDANGDIVHGFGACTDCVCYVANQAPPYRDIELALANLESAMDWIENQPNWTKDKYLRPIWKNLKNASHELRAAYFTCPCSR
jgi:hypothetical protein